jgi:hypothetical protein
VPSLRKERVFTIRELRRVCITCPHCATEVTLDMAAYSEPMFEERVRRRPLFTPRQCPACRIDYDTALTALDDLRTAYAALALLDGVVTFRANENED